MPIILDPPGGGIGPSPGVADFPTLADYRHRLAETAGFYATYITSAGSTHANQLVINDLISAGALESSFLGNTWVYEPTAPNYMLARRVAYNGLDPSSGTLTLDRAFPNITPIARLVEVYGRLPPVSMEGRLGLNAIVNRVLDECWTLNKVDIYATADNQRIFSLGEFVWLNAEEAIVDVYTRAVDAPPDADDRLAITWRWLSGGNNPQIELGNSLNLGDRVRILAIIPMSWWIWPTGWPNWLVPSAPGLQDEFDSGLITLVGMEQVGKAYIYDELGKWGLPDDQANYRKLAASARAAANEWKRLTLEHPRRRTLHWPESLSVPSRWGHYYGAPLVSRS